MHSKVSNKNLVLCVDVDLAEGRRGASTPPEVGRVVIRTAGSSSPHFVVESPPEQLSPSHQRVFRDDLSPVTDQPQSKRKIAINIGASPSGFILEEDEEEEEEENDEELEVVDARMFRPIVEPQSSGDQADDYEPDEVLEHVDDLGGEGTGQSLDVVIGQASLCDGPGEVSDDEGGRMSENFETVEMSDDVGEVLEAEPVAGASEDAEEFHFESSDHVVPDNEQLIDFDDNEEETDVVGSLPSSQQLEGPVVEDDVDLLLPSPPPPPPPEEEEEEEEEDQ